jgi:hypothetical protein
MKQGALGQKEAPRSQRGWTRELARGEGAKISSCRANDGRDSRFARGSRLAQYCGRSSAAFDAEQNANQSVAVVVPTTWAGAFALMVHGALHRGGRAPESNRRKRCRRRLVTGYFFYRLPSEVRRQQPLKGGRPLRCLT